MTEKTPGLVSALRALSISLGGNPDLTVGAIDFRRFAAGKAAASRLGRLPF